MVLEPSYQPKKIEDEVRRRWDAINVSKLIREASKGKRLVGYVEGPPTMNGEPHIGHIRGRILKDLWYRFWTLNGTNIVFRAGWDTQGLPVELQAEKELGLSGSKAENLKTIGSEALVDACKKVVEKYNQLWRKADQLLGMSFDYERAYWTYHDEYIEREWKYLEQAWKRGLLGEGYRVVAYCPSCQTSLSHAEVSQGYELVEDPSLYFKMKLRDEDAFLILWTTMPFTIVTDEMVGVKPDAEYAYVRIRNETWIVAKERVDALMKELGIEDYEISRTVLGSDLEGKKYIHPLISYISGQSKLEEEGKVHIVVAEDFVDTTTGSGLVHLSPANGEEDFHVAMKRGLPIFNPIDDRCVFKEEGGVFADMFVRDADVKVVELLKKEGCLIKVGTITHDYPTCWRSHHKLVWLARREYFYWVDRLGDLAVKAAENVEYYYEPPKNRFLEIVKEKVPWCISRERIWGTPLPIWVCSSCGEKVPVFSRKEIIEKAVELPDGPDFELHRPWIDRVVLRCPSCGGRCFREPFVLDTWHNSGAAPYASFDDDEHRSLMPAEFLTEGIDQTRGWAYTLLILNVILTGRPEAPYKAFLFQGHVLDAEGNKMSKSLGNIIDAIDALSNNPVDVLRFYLVWKAGPIDSLNFSFKEMWARPYQVLNTLYHLHIYYHQNSSFDGFDPNVHSIEWAEKKGLMKAQDRWLLSRAEGLKKKLGEAYRRCRFHEVARELESFIIEDLSQSYIPMTRGEIWDDSPETLDRRLAIYATLHHTLKTVDVLLHPISPYTTDYLYKACLKGERASIILERWPEFDDGLYLPFLEDEFDVMFKVVSIANSVRAKARVKRRWSLKKAIVLMSEELVDKLTRHVKLLLDLLNVKDVQLTSSVRGTPISVKIVPRSDVLGPKLKGEFPKLVKAVASMNSVDVFEKISKNGLVSVRLEDRLIDVKASELNIEYVSERGWMLVERDGIVVSLFVERDRELVFDGMIRDLARRLQALRKERGYNPTDMLEAAYLAELDPLWTEAVESRREELLFLVRVKAVRVMKEPKPEIKWVECEIDGAKMKISVE